MEHFHLNNWLCYYLDLQLSLRAIIATLVQPIQKAFTVLNTKSGQSFLANHPGDDSPVTNKYKPLHNEIYEEDWSAFS